jgi:hypothetical protein
LLGKLRYTEAEGLQYSVGDRWLEARPNADTYDERRAAFKARQTQRRKDLDQKRADLLARHSTEREALKDLQDAENSCVVTAQLEKQPKGLAAFLTRITGIVEYKQKEQDQLRSAQHDRQTEALKRRHDREKQDMDWHDMALARLETRENKSLYTGNRHGDPSYQLAAKAFLELQRREPQRVNRDDDTGIQLLHDTIQLV